MVVGLKCKTCEYLISREDISLMSQMMGYTGECSITGILFNLDTTGGQPIWCPIREGNHIDEKLQ